MHLHFGSATYPGSGASTPGLRHSRCGAPAATRERIQLPRQRLTRHTRVGLGWLIARLPGLAGPLLWHNGGTSGFRSFVGAVKEAGTAVVVLSNTARSVDRLGLRLLKALSGAA